MSEASQSITALDRKADRILEEMGLDPEGPASQLTYAAGLEFGRRFVELLPIDQSVIDAMVRELLSGLAAIFPLEPDAETVEFQAYMLGPMVSSFLAGRRADHSRDGGSRERLASAGLPSEPESTDTHLCRAGTPARTGVNRRFSGRDERETHHVVDPHGFAKKVWPAPVDAVQPFILGMMAGLHQSLERPEVRAELEPQFKQALSKLLRDQSLGELMDGAILALDRTAQGLRDTAPGEPGPILKMKVEREKAIQFQAMLAELSRQRPLVLASLAKAGQVLEVGDTESRLSLPPRPRGKVGKELGRRPKGRLGESSTTPSAS